MPRELPADPGLSPTLFLDNTDSHLQQRQTGRAIVMFLKGSGVHLVIDRKAELREENRENTVRETILFLIFDETSSHYIAQASRKLVIPLTEFPWCWNYRTALYLTKAILL